MSTKALKLLMLEKEKRERNEEIEEIEEKEELDLRSQKNIFSLLDNDSPLASEDEDISDEVIKKNSKKTKKKKKIKKNKIFSKQEQFKGNNIDDIVKEVNQQISKKNSFQTATSSSFPLFKSCFVVELKNLNVENEVKKQFGHQVLNKKKEQKSRNHKRYMLVSPKQPVSFLAKSGLSMEIMSKEKDGVKFKFVHSRSYQEVEKSFIKMVHTAEHNQLLSLVQKHPSHINSLLQMSEFCRISEDWQMASDVIEQALCVFELSFHPIFSLTSGLSRLDYHIRENRSFFLCLFQYMRLLYIRGCHRTSLEYAKLIFSLNPEEDPLGILLILDEVSLKSDPSFLINLFNEWNNSKNLFQLPNFAFSVPLAHFLLSLPPSTSSSTSSFLPSMFSHEEHFNKANSMVKDALLMYPSFLKKVTNQIGVVMDPKANKHPHFDLNQLHDSDALELLIDLYIWRSHLHWKRPEVLAWLESNVKQLIEEWEVQFHLTAKSYALSRKNRYQSIPRNVLRHLIVSEAKYSIEHLPPNVSNSSILAFDPLPPTNSISAYDFESNSNINPRGQTQASSLGNVFFQSLFPSFRPNRQAEQSDNHGNMGALLDALRQLIVNSLYIPMQDNENNNDVLHRQDWDEDNLENNNDNNNNNNNNNSHNANNNHNN